MSLTVEQNALHLTEWVGVEDAETLLAWLLDHPGGALHLATLKHLHAACLQVLMACRPTLASWPQDPELLAWLHAALLD